MRNGMSVQEVYAKLDRLEELERDYAGLATDYMDLIGKYENLIDKLGKGAFYLDHVAAIYNMVKDCPDATEQDELEFAGKISGLMEAKQYLLDILKDCLGSEEEENDLPGEAEKEESSV